MSELINGNWLQTMEGSLDNIESYTLATANALGATAGTATQVNKFGYNVDIDTVTPEVVAAFGGAFDPSTPGS